MTGLEDFRDELETCFATSCGFCEKGCPVYQDLKVKTLCMKGRNRTMLGLLQGRFEVTPAVVQAAFECTLCGNCDRWCALKNTDHTQAFREYLLKHGVEPLKEHSSLMASLKNYGNPWFQPKAARARWTRNLNIPKPSKGGPEVLLFAGCTAAVTRQLNRSLIAGARLLQMAKVDFATMGADEPCCGSTLLRIGQTEAFEQLSKENVTKLESMGIRRVVTPCPGCYTTLSKAIQKNGSSIRVTHISQEVAGLVKDGRLSTKKSPERITYHDPCHLGRLGGVFDEPRTIVNAIANFVEMPNSRYESRCCGAGAGLQSAFPKLSRDLASKRIAEAKAVGASTIVTSCPFCETQLRSVPGIKVADLMESLLDAVQNGPRRNGA